MDHYKSYDKRIGYNIRVVADSSLGLSFSEDHKLKISLAMKGRKINPEAVKKSSDSRRGAKRTDEQKKRISDSLKGRTFSNEHRKSISEGHARRRRNEPEND